MLVFSHSIIIWWQDEHFHCSHSMYHRTVNILQFLVYIKIVIKKLLDGFEYFLLHLEDYMCGYISFHEFCKVQPLDNYLVAG